MNPTGGLGSLLTGLTGLAGTGASIYGAQNAAEDVSSADTSAINTQKSTMGNIQSTYAPQTALGTGAMNTLATSLGTNGAAPNYSAFMNMPGYGFAVQQGTQAAERQAAAMGNAGNSGTAAMIGNQITGTAMGDYNTYIGQLQSAAGLGAQANTGVASGFLNTGENISNLQQNSGEAQASGVAGAAGAVSNALNPYGYLGGSGVGGGAGGLTGALGSIASGIGNIFGGGASAAGTGSSYGYGSYGNVAADSMGGVINPNDPYGGGNSGGYTAATDPNAGNSIYDTSGFYSGN